MMKTDKPVLNFTRQEPERLCHLLDHAGTQGGGRYRSCMRGDLGAVAKLRVTLTGDTLGDKAHEIFSGAGADA